MPTGYTAGIIDGTTKTFKDFAKHCMRAFGATIHMRDDGFNEKYKPKTPDSYHLEALKKAEALLKKEKNLSDKDIVADRKKELNAERKYCVKRIKEIKITKKRLNDFLVKAKAYQPPTEEHKDVKDFMERQLMSTLEHDSDTAYYDKKLLSIENELKNINASVIRLTTEQQINEDITYHLAEYKKELDRCADSNKWVDDFINSL